MEDFRAEYGDRTTARYAFPIQVAAVLSLVTYVCVRAGTADDPANLLDDFVFVIACGVVPLGFLTLLRGPRDTWRARAGELQSGYVEVVDGVLSYGFGPGRIDPVELPLTHITEREFTNTGIAFRTRDKARHLLPYAALPYADVQRLKGYFAAWKPLPSPARVAASPG